MRGDFSSWRDERRQNFNGVLHQQGRVLLDSDWNAETAIINDWEDTAGRDIIGAGVAAVPAEVPESFKVKAANIVGGQVRLTVAPGRVWADGLLAYLEAAADVTRVATFLEPPIQTPPLDLGANGTRDAVVLEVWREEINGFQLPNLLIEPALGGPDTTERVHTEIAFRLFRLTDPDDTCDSIVGSLQDNFDTKGKLTVELEAPTVTAGDCPLVEGGGYTGFEHNLYRIEIAKVKPTLPPMFKWSQFGGGLVGRGRFDATANTLEITANQNAINNSGLQQFYLEAVVFDPEPPATVGLGHWKVTYGAKVTLGSNDIITIPDSTIPNNPDILFGSVPASTDNVFFRLWNGIAAISDFDGPAPQPLQDGILLQFDPAAGANYVAADYWTFPVRAGEISNTSPLIDHKPPEGIHYHRVPLGILTWTSAANPAEIEDCRRVFQPLTKLSTCCTFRVGDGTHSHGDFTKIQDAVNALPPNGGEICVLPGRYEENVKIEKRRNITIKGCGRRSQVVSPPAGNNPPAAPVIHVIESQNIKIQSLLIQADDTGIGIRLEGRPIEIIVIEDDDGIPLLDITLESLIVRAATRSAIEAQLGYNVTIRRCRIEMKDMATAWPGIFFVGEDGLIEENVIGVEDLERRLGDFEVINPLDDGHRVPAEAALGGLQLGGGCERVRVINNVIARGIGTGIVLGSLATISVTTGDPVDQPPPDPDPCFPCRPGDDSVPEPEDETTRTVSAGDLYDILIERNRIFNMGLNGIGAAGFFNLIAVDEFISVHRLLILGNEIHRCLNRQLQDIPQVMLNAMGYGGIALADVDELVIRDNFITDNGPDFREPICGIFVLHGEGIEISRNHIRNNGATPTASQETAFVTKHGRRGGINIVFALAPVVPIVLPALPGSNAGTTAPVQAGFPALKAHDNVVSVPFGQALNVTALGNVSVLDNQFTSHSTSLRELQTFIASTVFIFNLGLSNELYLQFLAFAMLNKGQVNPLPQPGLDDRGIGKFLVNGNVLFANNQCALDAIERGFTLAFSSVLIFSLDDVGFHSNQCDCNLLDDFVLAQAILFGISVRASDNRFKEGLFNAAFSAITLGLFNTTTDNQSTHCLWIIGVPNLTVDHSNVALVMLANNGACCPFVTHREECFDRQGDRVGSGSPVAGVNNPQVGFIPG
jgi:Family of unknown function (DUF6519)